MKTGEGVATIRINEDKNVLNFQFKVSLRIQDTMGASAWERLKREFDAAAFDVWQQAEADQRNV